MARPDDLVSGEHYFLVHYLDEDLLVPEVMTVRFTSLATGDDGERMWLFQQSSDEADDSGCENIPLGLNEAQLYTVLDLPGLIAVLEEVQSVSPPPSLLPREQLTPQEVLEQFGLTARVEHFLGGAKSSVHISIRYTDHGLFLKKTDSTLQLHAFTHPLLTPQEDERLAGVLVHRGIPSQTDYLADKGRTRILHYQLPPSSQVISEICAEVLVRAYGISGSDELLFDEAG